jgi:hypothetical protein
MTINFHPEELDINLYSGDHSLLNFRVYSVDSEDYTATGSWGFSFYNKDNGGVICSTITQAENGDILPGAAPLVNLSASPLFNRFRTAPEQTAGVLEVYISGSVTNILSSSANNVGYEVYLKTGNGKVTFIKGSSLIESKITN